MNERRGLTVLATVLAVCSIVLSAAALALWERDGGELNASAGVSSEYNTGGDAAKTEGYILQFSNNFCNKTPS